MNMPLLAGDDVSGAQELWIAVEGRPQSLSFHDSVLSVASSGPASEALCSCTSRRKPHHELFEVKRVINVTLDLKSQELSLAVLGDKQLRLIRGVVQQDESQAAQAWADELLRQAYAQMGRRHSIKVIWNPASGQGKARKVWAEAERIFKAANCTVDAAQTSRRGHAREIALELDAAEYDCIALVSGDGLVHEVVNGLKARPDAQEVLDKLPVALIGAGTSNALACVALGPKKCHNTAEACLAIIKGKPEPIPLCKVQQPNEVFYSFLSQAFGLLADCDVGSDRWRAFGNKRVYVAYALCALAARAYPCEVELKVVESDKRTIKESFVNHSLSEAERKLRQDRSAEGEWITLPLEAATCVYAGTIPWTDPDFLAFPTARADGLIDISVLQSRSRVDLLTLMDGTDIGKFMDHDAAAYYRVSAYRLRPKKDATYKETDLLVIDGERIEYAAIEVSVEGSFLTLTLGERGGRFLPKPWPQGFVP